MREAFKDKLRAILSHRHLPIMAAALAVLLTLPSLGAGLFMDDNFIRIAVLQPKGLPVALPQTLDTFCFMNGDQETLRGAIDFGSMPWWVNPDVKGCFWRPIASITHNIDFRLWPERPWLMHLQSVLWYGALVLVAGYVFMRLMGATPAAGLAAILFAVEDAHSIPAVWLANRNSVIACLFGLLALWLHHVWREKGSRAMAIAAAVVFLISLLSAEAGIATMAYITAYALVLDNAPLKKRVLSLLPYIIVIICWRVVWSGLGYGVHNVPLYADPLGEPFEFAKRLFVSLPQMLNSQYFINSSEVIVLGTYLWPWTWGISAALTVFVAWIFWPMIRSDRRAGFLALGALFALVPACATLPQSRNLMFTSIGALGLLALWLMERPKDTGWPRMMKATAVLFATVHLVMAPLTLSVTTPEAIKLGGKLFDALALPETADLTDKNVIVVNHPAPFNMAYSLGNRALEGWTLPSRSRVLSQAFTPIILTRTSSNKLLLRTSQGIPGHFSRIVFTVSDMAKKGKEVRTEGMAARFTATDPDGLPTEAEYTFDKDIDDASMVWFWWSKDSFKPFTPPRIGESIEISGIPLPFGLKYRELDNTHAGSANLTSKAGKIVRPYKGVISPVSQQLL